MISTDPLHIKLNRTLLLTIGLWPYQQSKLVRVQLILFFGILSTSILFQFTIFLTSKCTMDLLINVLSSALYYTVFIIVYGSLSMNIEVVKYFLEQLQHICDDLSDENEIDIIKKYGSNAKHYTITLIVFVVFGIFVLFLNQFWPIVCDILFPINETRFHLSLLFITEYFVDQEKYYYLILIHINAATFIGMITMVGTGTLLIIYQQHACGMFRIASYRIEQAMAMDMSQKNNLKTLIYKGLIDGVDMHREAMKFSDLSISKFKVMFSLMMLSGIWCTAINYFQIFQLVSFGFNFKKFLIPMMSVLTLVLCILISGYIGQQIIDHNNDVYDTVYNVRWYTAPLQIQKMILFLLQRSSKVFNLNIGGLVVASVEGAATLMNATLSYFVLLHSTQNK
ncbi:uncharacterized protein LOC105426781 [Pogonomyrmex barbatus]|uniref:Odorant receptor n=1 Tax=Pogonomyrmex barbatus TaxID=144034 RepID=A0A8N1S785_9HYME|nr:uncharacterized protein LOC105426781 [Pogonomyrmex barbatus]